MSETVAGYNPSGPTEQRNIVASRDGWSEYELDDGTKIRAKCVVIDVRRATGQYDEKGDPVYVLQMASVNSIVAPDSLKKTAKK